MKSTFGEAEVTNSEIRAELKALSKLWRPWEEATATDSFKQYRNSATELYADSISVLLNNPALLQEKAPKFFDEFFNTLDNKPAVKQDYFELQAIMNGEREVLIKLRREGVQQMFQDADVLAKDAAITKQKEKKLRQKSIWFKFKFDLLSNSHGVIDKVIEAKKKGALISDENNPIYLLNERNYLGGLIKAEFEENVQPFYEKLVNAKIDWGTFGEKLFYERIIAGDRTEVANPRGITPDAAKELLVNLESQLTPEQIKVLDEAVTDFRQFVQDISDYGYQGDLYSDELYKQMKANPAYVAFQVLDYIDRNVSAKVYQQVGTLKDVNNPANSTLLKIISTIRAVENQNVKIQTINFFQQQFPDEIQPAKRGRSGQLLEPRESHLDLVTYYKKGKLHGVYVDKLIADGLANHSLDRNNIALNTLRFLNSRWYRPVFVGFNVGFQAFNLIRDFFRFWKAMPSVSIWHAFGLYGRSFRPAKVRAFGVSPKAKPADVKAIELIREMEKNKYLSVTFNDVILGQTNEDRQIDAIFKHAGVSTLESTAKNRIVRTIVGFLDNIKKSGDLIETLPKVATYLELKDKVPVKELGYFIRRRVGSPDFLEHGNLTPFTNDIFLFSNAILQSGWADYQTASEPKTRAGFWWKTAELNILPHILMWMAGLGVFGLTIKKIMDSASEYDKSNYTIIPLHYDAETGNATYLRLPSDETGRYFGALAWKLLNAPTNRRFAWSDATDILAFYGGQLPSLTPAIQAISATTQMLAGQNPYDWFRGRNVLTDDQFAAGGWDAAKPFLLWMFQQSGGDIFYKPYQGVANARVSLGQKALNLPIISNVVGRFIRITNYGQKELFNQIIKNVNQEKARQRITENELINKYLAEYQASDKKGLFYRNKIVKKIVEEMAAQYEFSADEKKTLTSTIKQKFQTSINKGMNDPRISAIISATTNSAKFEIIKAVRLSMPVSDFRDFAKDLRHQKVISQVLYSQVVRELL